METKLRGYVWAVEKLFFLHVAFTSKFLQAVSGQEPIRFPCLCLAMTVPWLVLGAPIPQSPAPQHQARRQQWRITASHVLSTRRGNSSGWICYEQSVSLSCLCHPDQCSKAYKERNGGSLETCEGWGSSWTSHFWGLRGSIFPHSIPLNFLSIKLQVF